MRRRLLLLCVALLIILTAAPAGAQEDEEARAVDITFDIGDFDAEQGDWPITVVYVSGDLDEGQPFTVYLGDDEGELWSSTATFEGPITAVTVVPFVAVGDVTQTAVAQDLPVVLDDEIVVPPPADTIAPSVLEDEVVVESPTPNPPSPPRVPNPAGPVTEVLGQGAGGGGGGVLALSMVLAVVLVAIVFRTPLPSQTTQRWTK